MRVALLDGPLFEYRLPFLKALQERVERLQVLVPERGFDLSESKLRASGLDVSYLRSVSVNRTLRYPLGFGEVVPLNLPCNVIQVLSRFGPDTVISGEMGLRTLQAAAYRRMHRNCRLVVWARLSEHSEASRGIVRQLTRKALLRNADAIVTNGLSGRRYLTALGADPSVVHVIHQASALDARPGSHLPGRALRLLYVGRLVTGKGLHLLLAALARRHLGPWTLTVVGDGPERSNLCALATRDRLPVRFTGFVPRTELPEILADHDVFVFPTLKDEWGLAVGEALGAGLPVLGSVYSEAVCEIVKEGMNGWTMKPDREESMHRALGRAFACTPAELAQARELARDSVRNLTPEVMAEQFVDVVDATRNVALSACI